VVIFRVVTVLIDAHHEVRVRVARRAEMTTFFAPALRCWAAASREVNRPVDSITTSILRSFQGRRRVALGEDLDGVLADLDVPSTTLTGTPRTPWVESYCKRCASIEGDVRSFTATTSMSGC